MYHSEKLQEEGLGDTVEGGDTAGGRRHCRRGVRRHCRRGGDTAGGGETLKEGDEETLQEG